MDIGAVIDNMQSAVWEGRWLALEMIWQGIVLNVEMYPWFLPLLALLLAGLTRKKIVRLVTYVAHTFVRAQAY